MSKFLPCHCEMAKVKYNGKEINSVLRCSNSECGITIDHDINGPSNVYMLLAKVIQKKKDAPEKHAI
jgi:hypothetical protein